MAQINRDRALQAIREGQLLSMKSVITDGVSPNEVHLHFRGGDFYILKIRADDFVAARKKALKRLGAQAFQRAKL